LARFPTVKMDSHFVIVLPTSSCDHGSCERLPNYPCRAAEFSDDIVERGGEPYAGNPHVRVCGGVGGQPPTLPGSNLETVIPSARAAETLFDILEPQRRCPPRACRLPPGASHVTPRGTAHPPGRQTPDAAPEHLASFSLYLSGFDDRVGMESWLLPRPTRCFSFGRRIGP
jgi:hypothetical protein